MEFRILGPLDVIAEAGSIEIRARKPRAVLALLVVNANHMVPAERLIDELWDRNPPPSAVTTLQTYVSQLRRLGVASLRTRPPGYLLEVGPDDVDAARFERALTTTNAGRDAPDQVARRLEEALGWWRGPALADFADEPWARLETTRLDGLRLDALARRADARLALGQHHELISDLKMLVEAEPFREQFCAQLMLALYRSGRQAEALRAYRKLRERLGEELGIEPSAALVRLEAAILRQEPELDWREPQRAEADVGSAGRDDDATRRGPVLEVTQDGNVELVALLRDRLTIGRSRANDVALANDRAVSRIHAIIERVASGWCLRDLGSRNGTLLNGEPLDAQRPLRDGDTLAIGGWRAVFRGDDSESGVTELG